MKCNCTLNNNFEVIGLCDIKKFNEKINEFKDKSWTEISISEILSVPKNFPNIEAITKAYMDIKITSTRIINTPISNNPNVEGMISTGKKLLISGYICENIVYISDTSCQSIHSIKFKIEFNTYIVIEGNIDRDIDKFCVYPCIENVYVNPLNKRTLNNSVTIFLFAHKLKRPPEIRATAFVFNNYDDSVTPSRITPIAKIEFDDANKELMVSSSGNVYTNPNVGTKERVFKFTLRGPNNVDKFSGLITNNENGDNFVRQLNNKEFEDGDLILLEYSVRRETILTNYPNYGKNYILETLEVQSFKIGEEQVAPNKLPNEIILNSVDDTKPVFLIGFDILTKNFLVNVPTNEVANPAFQDQDYFIFTLLGDDNKTFFFNAKQKGGQIPFFFYKSMMENRFAFNNIIHLIFEENKKVLVTNYPNMGDIYHFPSNPNIVDSSFIITGSGLKLYIYKLPNLIVVKSQNNYEVARVEFNKNTKLIIASYTGEEADTTSTYEYFNFILKNNDQTVEKLKSIIISNGTGENFYNTINNKPFEYGDKLIISYRHKDKIEIVNYPKEGVQYIPNTDTKIFEITEQGLK